MQISSRFTIATHMLIIIALKAKGSKVTSDFLASSVGVNPVIIRKTLSQLEKGRVKRRTKNDVTGLFPEVTVGDES